MDSYKFKNIAELFTFQSKLVEFKSFKNEYETINLLHKTKKRKLLLQLSLMWLKSLKKDSQHCNQQESSKNFREAGNLIYNSKEPNRDLLHACRLYTKAIFAAGNNSEALSLAYANRAMALQSFGYYKAAYEDCECALEYNYPERLQHKLIMRQAYCALKMCDAAKLYKHVKQLEALELNASFKQQLNALRYDLQELNKNEQINEIATKPLELHRHTQKIVKEPTARGRYMIAAQDILAQEHIFTERAVAFVPVNEHLICQQCAATQLIPIPCANCNAKVVYCSRKCRQEHAAIHVYECVAYQMALFEHLGISHLAFRSLLEGLPQILPELSDINNPVVLWRTLMSVNLEKYEYSATLRMSTHLNKMQAADICWFALTAELLVQYLMEYTNYFDLFSSQAACVADWQLIVSALLLRTIGQLISNAHTSVSIVPKSLTPCATDNITLLQSELWIKPYHVRLGQLHRFSDYTEIAAMNLPYLSICNHACAPSFQPKFDGRFVSTYATKNLPNGNEINNCYSLDYRKSKCSSRRAELSMSYHFDCECEKCCRSNPDVDYEAFHRYRCEQSNCRKSFVPQLHNFKWWTTENDGINCSICGTLQQCIWLDKFNELLDATQLKEKRLVLYKQFELLDSWLLDYNELKLYLANQVIQSCFETLNASKTHNFNATDFEKLTNIIKFYLRGIAAQSNHISIEFACKMTYLWDLIALKQYICNANEMQEMLATLEITSNECQIIFRHYFRNFIEDLLIQ